MKKILNLIITMCLVLSSCSHKQAPIGSSNKIKSNDCLPDSLSALVKGKKLLIEKYGSIDTTNYTFNAVLLSDTIWHIVAQPNVFENE